MWQSFAALNLSTESTFILARVGTENGSIQAVNRRNRTKTCQEEQKLCQPNENCQKFISLLLFFTGVTIS